MAYLACDLCGDPVPPIETGVACCMARAERFSAAVRPRLDPTWVENPARAKAISAAHGISLPILRAMPHLVAVRRPDGGAGDAVLYQDGELRGAMSATAEEAQLLAYVAQVTGARRALEIGSYVGWTACHLATMCDVICVDPFLELGGVSHLGDDASAETCERFLQNVRRAGYREKVTLIQGRSPEAVESLYVPGGFDLAFIDGWHLDGQPRRDVRAAEDTLATGGTVVLHDLNIPDVQDAACWLLAQCYAGVILPTPNWLGVFWPPDMRRKPPSWLWTLPTVRWLVERVPAGVTPEQALGRRGELLAIVAGRG